MLKKLCALAAVLLLAGCSGGGGGSGSGSASSGSGSGSSSGSGSGSGSGSSSATVTNYVSITVDQGPAALNTGPNAYTSDNVAFVSLTICAPGSTSNCQTIDHVMVDTGSVGLRLFANVLNSSLLSALPLETDTSSNPVGECYQYIDGYVFGSVRQGDLTIGGEKVANMPFHVMADSGAFSTTPKSCSAGGGGSLNTVQDFGANGVIGIGTTMTDCGALCASASTASGNSATYYDCPASGCSAVIARAASASAPFQQVPNPVAAMSVDNNGTVITLQPVASTGAATGSGTLYFGIGTQSNNALGSAQIYTATSDGFITATYKNNNLSQSFIDSGSSLYFFDDSTIATCSVGGQTGFYCPPSPLNLTSTISGLNGASGSGAFVLYNAQTQFSTTSNAAVPGVGGDPKVIEPSQDLSNSFDYGLPFFYGKSVYTAIEGRNAGGTTGPYFAF